MEDSEFKNLVADALKGRTEDVIDDVIAFLRNHERIDARLKANLVTELLNILLPKYNLV